MAAACSTPESGQNPAANHDVQPAVEPAATPVAGAPEPVAAPATRSPATTPVAAPVSQPVTAPAAPVAPPPPPKPRVAHLEAGHRLTFRTTRLLSTKTMKTGEPFSAILEEPITVGNWTIAKSGAKVDGRITESDKGGRVKGKASISVELTSLTLADGRKIEIVTSPVGTEAVKDKGDDAKKIGVGAAAGAGIGAIAGGGKGAAIGGLIGAGAGTAMRGDAAEIPAESVLTLELRSPVTIEEQAR